MNTAALAATREPKPSYLNEMKGWKSWLITLDHKRIGILYLCSILVFFLIAGVFALAMRAELATAEGDLFESDTYNKLFTLHGVIMIFFFLIPSVPAVLGNFLLPLMLGTKDVAFPRINLLSYYIFLLGGTIAILTTALGGVDTGWTFYTPYSSTYSNTYVAFAALAAFVTGFSSILTGLNFIVTIHKMRAPGMTWFRLPLFVWAHYATSLLMLLGTPVIAITLFLLMMERTFHIGIFDPSRGGDPVLFQHLFWFYSHPAVYIMILPAFGVISEVITCFSRKRIFGYHFIAFSSLAIAVIGFLVWGHHMYVTGQSTYAGVVFSSLTLLVGVPTAVKMFNWTATMYRGSIWMTTPMMYVLSFLGLFLIGGMTGLFLAAMGLDIHLHDTYFVVAHFHYVMVGGMTTAFMAGMHFWWPKITGRMYPENLGRASALMIFIGFNLTFMPQFVAGFMGMPRRYHMYLEKFEIWNTLSSAGAVLLGLGFFFPILYMLWSLRYGAVASANPWGAKGLEWEQADSPPLMHNFAQPVVVTEEPYNYVPEAMPPGTLVKPGSHAEAKLV